MVAILFLVTVVRRCSLAREEGMRYKCMPLLLRDHIMQVPSDIGELVPSRYIRYHFFLPSVVLPADRP